MLKNYLIIAFRNLIKERLYIALNVTGLAAGIACFLLIMLYVKDEYGYDRFFKDADSIYRVSMKLESTSDAPKFFAISASPLAPTLKKDFPEIANAIRLTRRTALIQFEDKKFYERNFFYADEDFFEVFSFPLLKGNVQTVLKEPFSAVLTRAMAEKYFGSADPVGKMIQMGDNTQIMVTGVAENLPSNTHFHFDVLCSFKTLESLHGGPYTSWWYHDFYTYIKAPSNTRSAELEEKIARISARYAGDSEKAMGLTQVHFLQPVKDIHLRSDVRGELEANGSITTLYIFTGIAFFILIIASVNYMNLSTARSARRAKEVGMRKIVGASRKQLIAQFLGESILMVFLSLFFGLLLMEALLPYFNELASRDLSLKAFSNSLSLVALTLFCIVLSILAGSYPSFFLSSFKALDVLKKERQSHTKGITLRKALVVFQFCLSIMLIAGTIVAWQQIQYMQTRELGLDKEQVMAIPMRDNGIAGAREFLKTEFKRNAGIIDVASSYATPGRTLSNIMVLTEGADRNSTQTMSTLTIDYDFMKTYKLRLLSGRYFSKEFLSDDTAAFMLNESGVKELGWTPENAIGRKFEWGLGKEGKIIGVVKDFHFNSLKGQIPGIVMHINQEARWNNYLSVRIAPGKITQALDHIRNIWANRFPNHPFEYFFVDADFDNQYQSELRFGKVAATFSVITIVIACLGLFGLAAFTAEQRTKEIGIRKTLGATIRNIAGMLSTEFLKLVVIAFLIAAPASWWLMSKWLEGFVYRMDLSWGLIALAGGAAFAIALLTVSFQSIRAALTNPVNSLRNE